MPSVQIETAIVAFIRKIPYGRVSSYGAIARAAGFPQHARRVAWTLRRGPDLPWHRVLGAGGEIKLRGDSGREQRFRLEAEGVSFRGRTVDMSRCEFKFSPPRQNSAGRSRSRRRRAALKLKSV